MTKGNDSEHFDDYREQTQVKHDILEAYLPAYYNILKQRNENLVYIDGFAGRGFYVQASTGQEFDGSPIRALQLIASNNGFSNQVSTIFIESDPDLYNQLEERVDAFHR